LYRAQNLGAAGRLVASLLLHVTGWLSAVTMVAVNTAAMAWMAVSYTRAARPLVTVPAQSRAEVRWEMARYLAPIIPVIAFTAIQSQILVFLISIFGRTQSISEVAALGRLGQLFVILGAVNSALVEPYFSRLDSARLPGRYLQVVGAAIIGGGGLAAAASLFPEPFLWLLGKKYEHLDVELAWMMNGSCVAFVASVMWTIHAARKWVYWWGSALYIAAVTTLQVVFVLATDLNTTLGVLHLGFATNMAILVVHALTAVICLSRERGHRDGPPGKGKAGLSALQEG
jgi:hypothetical protein